MGGRATKARFRRSLATPPKAAVQVSPAAQMQKRQIDSDDDEHQPKRVRLTRKNLARFNKMGRKKASDKASTNVDSIDNTTTTNTSSATSTGFGAQVQKNGLLDSLHSKPPTNLHEIHERYARTRATASPPAWEYRRYIKKVEKAGNEATMVVELSGRLLKDYDDDGYNQSFNRAFTGFPEDVGFNNGLSAPQPDLVEGPEMQYFRPFPVDEYINGAVLYKDDRRSVTLPHLAGEWKGPEKDMAEARLQTAYDGAALVYARNQALAYLGKPDPPGHAEVITFTTDGANLNLYAHYATPSGDGTLEYHQYPIKSTGLIDSHQGHKDGRRGLRNEQDHARDQSYALRDQLKEHWKQRRQPLITEGPHLDDIPEELLPARGSNPGPDEDGEAEEPPAAKPTRSKRTSRKAAHPPRAADQDGEEAEAEQPLPSAGPTRQQQHKRTRRKRPPAPGADHDGEAEDPLPPAASARQNKRTAGKTAPSHVVLTTVLATESLTYAPTPPPSSGGRRRRSTRLSNPAPTTLG